MALQVNRSCSTANWVTSAPGQWLVGDVPCRAPPAGSTKPVFEFVITDGNGGWDKPEHASHYSVSQLGIFSLRHGGLQAVAGPPAMIVSDLDGTMVGDDGASGEFKWWWENVGVLRGGLLVYNTGRSLESFKELLWNKGHSLAHPDVLISAVGTKIYNFTDGEWKEDRGWAERLNKDWNVDAVREAAYDALAQVGKDSMHFRPPNEQNSHKVTCGVQTNVLKKVTDSIRGALDRNRVAANIITSGTGDWRFLDLVPRGAGKLEALEYVRGAHRFALGATVACGDSGNDILMLSGKNLALVVGNAQSDLVQWLEGHKGEPSPLEGKKRLYRARSHEARGILEGLEYWGLK